jgi:quercetin dioxygenase-like cupin family protein
MPTIIRPYSMSRRSAIVAAGFVMALLVAAISILPSLVRAADPPPPIAVELITPIRAQFTDSVDIQVRYKYADAATAVLNMPEASNTLVARFTLQPGAQFPWHTHPGPVLVNVAQGKLVYVQASDCIERDYPAGTAFVDPGRGNVHTAYNASEGVTIVVATFLDFPAAGPLSITDVVPGTCDIQVGTHAGH